MALIILLIGAAGGHLLIQNMESSRKNEFTAVFVFGYVLALIVIPAVSIALSHLHFEPKFCLHLHSISEYPINVGPIMVDKSLLVLIVVVLLIFVGSFELNQFVMWKMVEKLGMIACPELSEEIKALYQIPKLKQVELLVLENSEPDAYSFALLRKKVIILPFRFRDVVVITTGLINLLTKQELETVLVHELVHVENRDTVFVPFFKTISSLMFFDPLLKIAKNRIVISREFLADKKSAYRTERPKDLARALLKIFEYPRTGSRIQTSVSLFGGHSESILLKRILRLITLAEKMGSPF